MILKITSLFNPSLDFVLSAAINIMPINACNVLMQTASTG